MKFKLLITCICIVKIVSAQILEEKGSVGLQSGIILNGTIGYYFDHPTDIIVTDVNGIKKPFISTEVKTIILDNGKRFVSMPCTLNEVNTQLILQSLIESEKISLYMQGEYGNAVFYVAKDGILYRLENNESIYKLKKTESAMDREGNHYKVYDHKYLGTLNYLMSDQPGVNKKGNKLELEEDDLTDLIVLYNKGNVSYYWKKDSKIIREPYWSLFGQYSNYRTYNSDLIIDPSYSLVVGGQYNFSKSSRSALKYSFDYTDCHFHNYNETSINLGVRFTYDFVRSEYYSLYFLLHVADLTHYSGTDLETKKNEKHVTVSPHFTPGFGLDVRLVNRISVYGELNSLFQMEYLPRNFSFGLKYRLAKKED